MEEFIEQIGKLVQVSTVIGGSPDNLAKPTIHMMHENDVKLFIEATLNLHYEPGINPYNGEKTSTVWEIRSEPVRLRGKFWWTQPDLGKGGKDARGATLFGEPNLPSKLEWRHPELTAYYEED